MNKWLVRLKHHPQKPPCDQVSKVPKATTPPVSSKASTLACLLQLPDGRQFWLAPDGMKFDSRGIPIIRRSIMDELVSSGADVKAEIMRLIDGLHVLGGEVSISQTLPETEKAHSGDLRKTDHG